jgi:TATA-box binding protein (TBP) (component of TFIID and TFIIIB)
VKYNPSIDDIYSKEISIFIFEKGNIIITGAKSKEDLISSYNYIIMSNKEYIYKSNCIDNENLIIKIYNEIMFEIKNKYLHII